MNKPNINAEDLVQRVLAIMDREITCIENNEESFLSDTKLRMLPQFLRIILASKSDQKDDEEKEEKEMSILSAEELMEIYQLEKSKKK